MDVLFDYRPALVQRSGVGEYVHELASALVRQAPEDARLHIFSSSYKDRLALSGDLTRPMVIAHDRKVPVRLLNWLWHRGGAPRAEWLAGNRLDVTHAAHPIRIPSRRAASVVTIHDLDFLDHPERTSAEVRRDYAGLVERSARNADAVISSSRATADQIVRRLHVPAARVTVARPGVPPWARGARSQPRRANDPMLFVGTLEPRKNVGALLEAYARLLGRRHDVARLLLAGRQTPAAAEWLQRIARPPLAGHVDVLGYVPDADRRALFERASLLVLPSWHEGFGLPVLEALALGVPVVVSDRGALPEVAGDAALYCDPGDADTLADAIARTLDDEESTTLRIERGRARVAAWSWDATAVTVWQVYRDAVARRAEHHAHRD